MNVQFENWYQSQPHHEVLNDPTFWQFAFDAFIAGQISQSTQQTDYATIAGLESSVSHLSEMVDELRLFLGNSMDAMKEIEQNGNVDCRVPYGCWSKFVDTRAKLLYAIKHSPHSEMLNTQLAQKSEEQS
jgi:accessory colonization factor AcfC